MTRHGWPPSGDPDELPPKATDPARAARASATDPARTARASAAEPAGKDGPDRLLDRAEVIASATGLPPNERADIAEELVGHLRERRQALVDLGEPWDRATDRALAEFGDPAVIARDFQVAAHGRLWASTIGLALPPVVDRGARPAIVRWLVVALRIAAVLGAIGAVAGVVTLTPLRAVTAGVTGLVLVVVAAAAAVALARGAAWARWYAVGLLAVVALIGLVTTLAAGGIHVSVSGWFAVALLVVTWRDWAAVEAWAATRVRAGRLAGVAGTVLAMVSLAGPIVAAELPDPTQIGPEDVRLVATASCWEPAPPLEPGNGAESDPAEPGDETIRLVQTVTVDLRLARADVAPFGLVGGPEDGRVSTLEVEPFVAGELAWTASDPADLGRVDLLPGVGLWPATIPIGPLAAGDVHRFSQANLVTAAPNVSIPTEVRVRYRHLDRFDVVATVAACEVPVVGAAG